MQALTSDTIVDGKYRVIDILGSGGMGIVYRVEQLSLNAERALKTIHTAQMSDDVWQRFQREAKAASRLEHSNLVKVFDYGQVDQLTPYYVMEIVSGETLSARVKIKGILTLEQCLQVFIPTAFALAYAHEKSIIHRDMKPANIMFTEINGSMTWIKVLDFGIAKLVSDDFLTNALTKPGEVIGSPHFMSPEQSCGGKIDQRSDVYSLGCTMFEALTGLPPFIAKNPVQVIMMHQNTCAPTLQEIAPTVSFDPRLELVVKVMLAKDPDHRYQKMDDLAQDLIAIKAGKIPIFAQAQSKLIESSSKKIAQTVKLPALNSASTSSKEFDTDSKITVATGRPTKLTYPAMAIMSFLLLAAVASIVVIKPAVFQTSKVKSETIGGDSNDATERAMAPCLKDIDKPFSQTGISNGNPVTIFDFPAQVSLGKIISSDHKHEANAQGKVTIPSGEMIRFEPNSNFLKYPKLFRRFKASEIEELDLKCFHRVTDQHIAEITHLTRLHKLDLGDADLTSKCCNDLNKLPVLEDLNVSNSGLDDHALSRLKRLRQLSDFEARELPTLKETLKALAGSTRLRKLMLSNSALNDQSLKLIAQNRNLEYLSVAYNPQVTSVGVTYLLPLKKLDHLNLLKCHISPKSVNNLLSFKDLQELRIHTDTWTQDQIAALQNGLPRRCRLDRDLGDTIGTKAALKDFNELREIGPQSE